MPDARTERAERMAQLAWRLAEEPTRNRQRRRLPAFWRSIRLPVGRRYQAVATRELIETSGYDRGALLRGAELMERRGENEQARIARYLLMQAVGQITSR